MPWSLLFPSLALSVIEPLLNRVIRLDPNGLTQLQKIAGKQLAVEVLDSPIQLVITAQADGLWLNQHQDAVDCRVKVRWQALKQLSDPSQITRLIRQEQLDIEGDLHALQKFSQFFSQLNPDWQEALARVIGDGNSYRVSQLLFQLQQTLQARLADDTATVSALLHDELALSAPAAALQQFADEVRQLEARTIRLSQQLANLRNPS